MSVCIATINVNLRILKDNFSEKTESLRTLKRNDKIEITTDEGIFFGIIDRLGYASMTMKHFIPVDVENEDKYIGKDLFTVNLDDILHIVQF